MDNEYLLNISDIFVHALTLQILFSEILEVLKLNFRGAWKQKS